MEQMSPTSPLPVVQRVRHELKLRELEVVAIEPLGPSFLSITLGGESLADFVSLGFDDHVKIMFDGPDGQVRRDYTPRRHDREARRLTIEFALHGDGAASDWARAARVGDPLTVGGPRGSMVIPLDLDWQLLAGDATALPAVARRLEELPAGAHVEVLVLAGADEQRTLDTHAAAQVRWFDNADAWLETLRALALPAGTGFAWAGGEAALMAQVRQALQDKGLARQATRVSAYWKRGVQAHHENLE